MKLLFNITSFLGAIIIFSVAGQGDFEALTGTIHMTSEQFLLKIGIGLGLLLFSDFCRRNYKNKKQVSKEKKVVSIRQIYQNQKRAS